RHQERTHGKRSQPSGRGKASTYYLDLPTLVQLPVGWELHPIGSRAPCSRAPPIGMRLAAPLGISIGTGYYRLLRTGASRPPMTKKVRIAPTASVFSKQAPFDWSTL